jgi:hypothetical protein
MESPATFGVAIFHLHRQCVCVTLPVSALRESAASFTLRPFILLCDAWWTPFTHRLVSGLQRIPRDLYPRDAVKVMSTCRLGLDEIGPSCPSGSSWRGALAPLLDLGTRCVGVDWDSTSRFAVFYFKDWVWSPGQPSLFYDYISAWSSPQPNPLFK